MLRAPSTTALLCFETSARLGSFTRAAKELHLTQGAVSRQVIGLEQRLGVALFIRKSHASVLALTDAGRTYLAEVAPLLLRLERATADVMAHQGRGGTLTVSVGASLGSYWLMPRLTDFTRLHPEIVLNVATRLGAADFGTARIDASIEFGDGKRNAMDSHYVLPLQLGAYASPAWIKEHSKLISAQTPQSALIHHSTVTEAWTGWYSAAGIPLEPAALGPRYDLMSMALNAAIGGMGAVLLPSFMVTQALASKQLRPLNAVTWTAQRAYYLVHPILSRDSRALQTFKSWLLSAAQL